MLKIYVLIILFILVLPIAFGQVQPVQPIARTEQLIKDEHKATRNWCQQQWDSKEQALRTEFDKEKEELREGIQSLMYWDRILSFGSLFIVLMLGFTFKSFLDLRRNRKAEFIKDQETDYNDLPMPEPPKPTGQEAE